MGTKSKKPFPVPITQKWLEERGRFWQERLRLDDWVIYFKVMTADDVPDSWGLNQSHTMKKIAHISVRDRDSDSNMVNFDPEVTLVHELLHCHINTLRPGDDLSFQEEFVIEALSAALVAADRGEFSVRQFPGVFEYKDRKKGVRRGAR